MQELGQVAILLDPASAKLVCHVFRHVPRPSFCGPEGATWPRARRPTGEAVSATLSNHQNARPSRESELQPGFLISGGSDQLTFFVTLGESCSAFGSISRLGVVSLFRLKARPIRPNAISKIPAIISQCGYSSARSICPHMASTPRSGEEKSKPYRRAGGSRPDFSPALPLTCGSLPLAVQNRP